MNVGAMRTSPTAAEAQLVSYLNSVLGARGAGGLPYPDDLRWHVREHVLELSQRFPSLLPGTGVFTHNDGRSATLLRAEGTLPIHFKARRNRVARRVGCGGRRAAWPPSQRLRARLLALPALPFFSR